MGNYYIVYGPSDELAHWGIKGMKWGRRRYQNPDGSLTRIGKLRYATMGKSSRDKWVSKMESERQDELRKEAETFETRKQKALKSGSAADVMKFYGHLTQQELDDAKRRLTTERDIAKYAREDAEAAKKSISDAANKFIKNAEIGAKTWNTVANFVNTFYDVNMPKIDTNISGSKNKDNNKDNNK